MTNRLISLGKKFLAIGGTGRLLRHSIAHIISHEILSSIAIERTLTLRFLSFGKKVITIGGTAIGAVALYRYQAVKTEESNLPTNELWSFTRSSTKSAADTSNNKKQCIIIGGGVVGITAAWKLALKGHSVLVLEPNSAPGKECSACAAGGMQRSNPVVDQGTWIAVTKSFIPLTRYLFGGSQERYKFFHIDWFETLTDPFFVRWSATFARTSLFPCSDQQRLRIDQLSFTDYAVRDMMKMMKDKKDPMAKISGFNPMGSLSLSYDNIETKKRTLNNPTHGNTLEPSKQLEGEDITSVEPSIINQVERPTGAIYEFETCAASSERFTEELAKRCANDPKLDVSFLYNTRVKGMKSCTVDDQQHRRVSQIQTNRGVINVPKDTQVLIAAGAWTSHIAALMDLYAPVYPLKGYAMSISADGALQSKMLKPADLPTRIVCDKYMFTSRLGDEVRVTSIGEFSGWKTSPTESVEKEFRREAVRQFPKLEFFIKDAIVKCGHRPYVSDGILLLGRVDSWDNLLVSCGPGKKIRNKPWDQEVVMASTVKPHSPSFADILHFPPHSKSQ